MASWHDDLEAGLGSAPSIVAQLGALARALTVDVHLAQLHGIEATLASSAAT